MTAGEPPARDECDIRNPHEARKQAHHPIGAGDKAKRPHPAAELTEELQAALARLLSSMSPAERLRP